ncbi:carbohydrate ABC transporter permease [Enterocloster asparagiformis]|uniref:carbohydrate ABC transporter permease n=1 Tax=Enterocloster asparagiformis TaxID=333367 RepID=UPI0034B4BA64
MKKGKKIRLSKIFLYLLIYGTALLWLFPVVWMIVSSFKPYGTPVSILQEVFSGKFTVENYRIILEKAPILRWTFNSFFVSATVTLCTLVITSLAAYALSKLKFKGKGVVFLLIASGMMIPMESIIIPLYQAMAQAKLLNTYAGLIYPSLASPIGVLIMKRFYDSIPDDLIEAAVLDGAGPFERWWNICFPVSKSSMAAVGIFTFTSAWNNFLWPFLSITSEKMMTLPVGIPQFQGANLSEFTLPMTASVVASVPAIIVFIIFQKQIIKGIAMTGIKG